MIKAYFGETIALYFSFLEFYTQYLIPPAVIGFLYFCFFPAGNTDNVVFAILNVIWATVFLELWKRKGATIVYQWGRLKNSEGISIRSLIHLIFGAHSVSLWSKLPCIIRSIKLFEKYGRKTKIETYCLVSRSSLSRNWLVLQQKVGEVRSIVSPQLSNAIQSNCRIRLWIRKAMVPPIFLF